MEITKELKEKLLKANSEEEVKALLGGSAEGKTSEFWQEIEAHHGALGLEKVDDDELEEKVFEEFLRIVDEQEKAEE